MLAPTRVRRSHHLARSHRHGGPPAHAIDPFRGDGGRGGRSAGRRRGDAAPYTLRDLRVRGKWTDIGRDRLIVLRDRDDLAKIDDFSGLQGVSLARLDLRTDGQWLRRQTFDTRTVSISLGGFAGQPHHEEFQEAMAAADSAGVLVVTCAREHLPYGLLVRPAGADPDDPHAHLAGLVVDPRGFIARVRGLPGRVG